MATKKVIPIVSCKECRFATLHQWMKNPIISICSVKNGERFVASCPMPCERFKMAEQTLEINHHERYE